MKKIGIVFLVFLYACHGSKKAISSNVEGIPACISQQIANFRNMQVQNPPRSIYTYKYNNKTVYYIPSICCDQFSDLLDSNCVLLGHPDGGFSGKGDMLLLDFRANKTEERLIWKDERVK